MINNKFKGIADNKCMKKLDFNMKIKSRDKLIILEDRGFLYLEILISLSIFGICAIFILQGISVVYNEMVRMRVYFLGAEVVHEKIEQFRSIDYVEIREGEYSEKCYSFIERRWIVKDEGSKKEICVISYSNTGNKLYQFCILRFIYE